MTTIQDVARRAGVSLATVSRVTNGNPSVRAETRIRVERAMSEVGYRPNEVARAMVKGRTMTLGLIVADISNPFFAETAGIVVSQARQHKYDVLLCNTENDDPLVERHYLEVLTNKHVDGIISGAARLGDPELGAVINQGIPVVCYNRHLGRPDSHYIVANNRLGGQLGVEHLIRLGHHRISFLSGPLYLSTGSERLEGYMAAMKAAGLDVLPHWVQSSRFHHHEAYAATRHMLTGPARPTAIFAGNDLMALAVVECAYELGLRVPDDLSVLGFDDIEIASHRAIELSTVSQRKEEMGRLAVQAMVQILAGRAEGSPIQVELRPELRVRRTTGLAPIVD